MFFDLRFVNMLEINCEFARNILWSPKVLEEFFSSLLEVACPPFVSISHMVRSGRWLVHRRQSGNVVPENGATRMCRARRP